MKIRTDTDLFLTTFDELAVKDQNMSDSKIRIEIFRTLPENFNLFAMDSSLNEKSFDKIFNDLQENIERKKLRSRKSASNITSVEDSSAQIADVNNFSTGGNNFRGPGRGQGNRGRGEPRHHGNGNESRTCLFRRSADHFIKLCALRITNEESGRICKPNHHRGNRYELNFDQYR